MAYGAGADSGLAYGVGNPMIPHEVGIKWEEVSSTKAGQKSGIENLSSISEPHELVAMDRFSSLPSLPQDFKPFVLDRSFEELFFGALHKFKSSPDALSQIIGKVSDLGPSKMPDLLADLKFIDAQGNAIGDDLLEFLLSADDIAVFERRLGAWDALSDLPASVKTDVFNLQTVSRHLDETGMLADDVAAEIAQSGSFNKWLSDHFVTYIKNGYNLTKANIDDVYGNHLQVVVRVEKANAAGVVVGHNRNAFMSELYDPVDAPNKRVVLHTNETGNGVNGFTLVEYKTYAVQAPPNDHLLQQPLTFNGNPPATGLKTKTLYDPSTVSQSYLKEMAYKGFKDAIDNNRFPGTFFEGHVGSIKVVGHTNSDGGIASWWLEPL